MSEKEVEIKEVNAKNSKLEAIEFLREMAGYPQTEYATIAKRLKIPQSTARDYLKRYIWGVLHTLHDTDYPRRLMEIYNHDSVAVPPNKALTHKDINYLNPIVNRYARFSYADQPESKKEPAQEVTTRKVVQQRPRTIQRAQTEEEEDEKKEEEEDELSSKKLMGDVAGSQNAQLLYNILKTIPGIGNPKIRRYLKLFALNEADYMANPERFKNELKVNFGDGPGTMVYNSFVYGMSAYGRPGQGIGFNPYSGQAYSGSTGSGTPQDWIKANPNLETYYRMNIIPYGVPPDSPIAVEAVNRFHEKQRRKEQSEEEDMNFNRWLKAKTAKTMDENMGGQQGGGMGNNMWPMVMAGMMEMRQGIDENGKPITTYVPRQRQGGGMFGDGGDGNSKEMGLLQTIISGKDQLINTLISKSMEQPKMMESLLGRFIQNMDPDPTAQLARMKQFAETLYPQNQSLQNNMEAMRLRLEEIRLTKDMQMADSEAKRQFDKERWEKERQERMEAEASKNTQHIMDGILGLGKEMLGPAMAILGGKGLAGMIPGMGGQPGGMPGMGGIPGMSMPPNPFAPQQQQPQQFVQQPQQNRMSPETFAYMKQVEDAKRQAGMQTQGPPQAGPYPGARPQEGFRPFVESPRRPPVMQMGRGQSQDVIEEYSEGPGASQTNLATSRTPQPRNYNPDQFENATPEVLSAAEKEALRRKAELDSYINSLRIAKRKKTNVFRTKRPTPQNVIEEEEIAVAPTVGGGIDTTVSPPADVRITHPRSEVGSVEIPEMIPEKAQRDDVEVPGEEKEDEEEGEEFEEDEDEEEEEAVEGEEREEAEDNIEEAK